MCPARQAHQRVAEASVSPESCQNKKVEPHDPAIVPVGVRPKYAFRHAHRRTNLTTRKCGLPCPVGMAVLAPGNMSAVFKDVEAQPGCLWCSMCGLLWKMAGPGTTQQSVHTADSRDAFQALCHLSDLLACIDTVSVPEDGSSLCVCSVHFFGKAGRSGRGEMCCLEA